MIVISLHVGLALVVDAEIIRIFCIKLMEVALKTHGYATDILIVQTVLTKLIAYVLRMNFNAVIAIVVWIAFIIHHSFAFQIQKLMIQHLTVFGKMMKKSESK